MNSWPFVQVAVLRIYPKIERPIDVASGSTVCTVHHLPLLLRRRVQLEGWTRWQLDKGVSAAYANSFGHFTGPKREPWVHYYFIYALIELQRAVARAVSGIRPPRRQWGHISCKDFLEVLRHVLGARALRLRAF